MQLAEKNIDDLPEGFKGRFHCLLQSGIDKKLFDELMDTYYAWLGWDSEKGWPTRKTLEDLGLKDVADRLGV